MQYSSWGSDKATHMVEASMLYMIWMGFQLHEPNIKFEFYYTVMCISYQGRGIKWIERTSDKNKQTKL